MRLNITLPDAIGKELKTIPNKSRYIAEALRTKIRQDKQAKMAKEMAIGYKTTNNENVSVNREWETITLEGWE